MKHVVLSLVSWHDNDNVVVAKTIWDVVEDEEEYCAYIGFSKVGSHGSGMPYSKDEPITPMSPNSFETLMNYIPDEQLYSIKEAENDL